MTALSKPGFESGLEKLIGHSCLAGIAAFIALLTSAPAMAASQDVVISQVYGGGGNTGTTWKNDFIELHNRGASAITLNGWSVQYASAAGTTWQVTNLGNVTLQPGQFYLIQEAQGVGGTQSLPTPDATGTIAMSSTTGKVALVTSTTALSGACPTTGVKDLIGFGTANCSETSPTAALSSTTAALRNAGGNGCTDTDSNSSDFTIGTPNPRNTASTIVTCSLLVDGACGTDNGQTLAAASPTNLCAAGNASSVTGSGHPWNWSCNGLNSGISANCSATIQSYTLNFSADVNGSLTGSTSQTVDFGASATPVTAIPNGTYTFLNWSGTGGFATSTDNPLTVANVSSSQNITANFTQAAINGACGSASGQSFASAPSANLCATGIAGSVTGTGPWNWSCTGSNGGSAVSCSAVKTLPPGPFTVFHTNDVHARLTPHKWIISQHGSTEGGFEDVGGAAYVAGEMLALTSTKPDSLVLDGGDISEGNPIGDMNCTRNTQSAPWVCDTTSIFGNGGMTSFYELLHNKLTAVPGRNGRGIDALVVGNHDVRDLKYVQNMEHMVATGVPVISANVRDIATHAPHFPATTMVTVNGTKVGIIGFTTPSAQVGASLANTLEVVDCPWSGGTTGCNMSSYVSQLRSQGANVVILLTHDGHSDLVDPASPVLADTGVTKLPEIVVSGHWHTWAETAWQPDSLNYKTTFTESSSYMKFIGELNVDANGKYLNSVQHVLRNTDITPDQDVQALVSDLTALYNSYNLAHPVEEIVGYSNSNLMLDNVMKWWSANEYPWNGNNTAGQWITDAMKWKCDQIWSTSGGCDLAVEAGGGVRSDIPKGAVTLLHVYETFPWADDTYVRITMSGQDIINFLKTTNLNAGFSRELEVSANDGIVTSVLFNGQPINPSVSYKVAINNYMLAHPPAGYTWPTTVNAEPDPANQLVRDSLLDFMRQQHSTPATAYDIGGDRYHFNGEYSGGYRVVVTMMNDNDTKPTFEDAFIRFISANPETLGRRGSRQVPASLVNANGSIVASNRYSEQELYRSHLGFKAGALVPGDIIEVWGKSAFYQGNPEFVDQEGIYGDGLEFKIVGHDDSLAKPTFVSSIGGALTDNYKNHYVSFLAKKVDANNVVDQFKQTLKIWDKTGFTARTLPGTANDTLLLSGVVTMENFGYRFRCDNAAVSNQSLPVVSNVVSHVDPLLATSSESINLTATASLKGGTYSLTPVADAQVASGNPTTNYGTATNVYVQSSSVNAFRNERIWLKFDLSSIPAGSTISNAALRMWNWKSVGAAITAEVRSSNDDTWTETALNWNSQPVLGTLLSSQVLASGTTNVWYEWDTTAFVQAQFGGDKTATVVVKAATENSADATAPGYGFDAREYGSNMPVLEVTTQSAASSVAGVSFFYRYSSDKTTWTAWTQTGSSDTLVPYSTNFAFSNGYGYYEFYSVATDNLGGVESIPAYAQASTHYQAPTGMTQTISTFPPLAAMAMGGNATLPSLASTSGMPVTFSSLTPNVCTVSGNSVSAQSAGVCTVAADQVGDIGYWVPAQQQTQSFVISSESSTKVPVPMWAIIALGGGLMFNLVRIAARQRRNQF